MKKKTAGLDNIPNKLLKMAKSGSKSNPGDYQPISIIPGFFFQKFLKKLFLIPNVNTLTQRRCFKSLHSTVTAVREATSD